jgi:hypothetical protein
VTRNERVVSVSRLRQRGATWVRSRQVAEGIGIGRERIGERVQAVKSVVMSDRRPTAATAEKVWLVWRNSASAVDSQ